MVKGEGMSKILFLAGAYFPEPKANGICCERVISTLQERGHEIDMVAFAPDFPGKCCAEVNGVRVHYVRGSMYYRTLRAEETGSLKGIRLKMKKCQLKMTHLFLSFSWPNISPLANIQFYKKAYALHEENQYDVVVAVYSPFNALYAAAKLKRKFPNIKYIAYFLDSLSGGALPSYFPEKISVKKALHWENKLLKQANVVMVMRAHLSHLKKYASDIQYISRISVQDIPLIRTIPVCPSIDDGKIHVVFVGAINTSMRSPEYVLKIIEKIPHCVVDFYGSIDKPEILKKYVDNGVAIVHGKVSHDVALEAEQKADFLLNIGNRNTSLVPSKIFEYISTGKPVITTCPISDEPSLPYLRKYELCFEVYEEERKIEENIKNMSVFIRETKGKHVPAQFIEKHFKENMPEYFVDTLEHMIKE